MEVELMMAVLFEEEGFMEVMQGWQGYFRWRMK